MIGGNGERERRPTDLYPTPPDVTEALLRFLDIPSFFRVWDPAAGEGDMARQISAHGHKSIEQKYITLPPRCEHCGALMDWRCR